jgi:hypothetical protein
MYPPGFAVYITLGLMNRIPSDLDLSCAIGQRATQLRVGEFDIQFSLGSANFNIQSPIELRRNDVTIGKWQEGQWPDEAFGEILNELVVFYNVPNDRELILSFQNGIQMHLIDDSDQYETMSISIEGSAKGTWYI